MVSSLGKRDHLNMYICEGRKKWDEMGWRTYHTISYTLLAAATFIGAIRHSYPLAIKWHNVISKNSDRNGGDGSKCQGKDKKRTQATRADDETK